MSPTNIFTILVITSVVSIAYASDPDALQDLCVAFPSSSTIYFQILTSFFLHSYLCVTNTLFNTFIQSYDLLLVKIYYKFKKIRTEIC